MIDEWRGASVDGNDIACDAVGNVCPWRVANETDAMGWNISAAAAVLMVCTTRNDWRDSNFGDHDYFPLFRAKSPWLRVRYLGPMPGQTLEISIYLRNQTLASKLHRTCRIKMCFSRD